LPAPATGHGSTDLRWWSASLRYSRASRHRSRRPRASSVKRASPTLAATLIAAAYVIVSPPSEDLAAHLLRAKLFSTEGFGIWNNWWYGGHNVPGYSVLFPPLAAWLTPQLAGAIAAPPSAALFESLAYRRFGPDAWLGSLWFGVATGTSLFTGRLTFAFGLLPALATAVALQRRRPAVAGAFAAITALCSPVDALFIALVGAAHAIGSFLEERAIRPALPGIGVIVVAGVPVLALAIAFPEGGTEPFVFSALWPIVLIAVAAVFVIPPGDRVLRAGAALYACGCLASYAIASPVGSNLTRLGPLIAGPLLALLWWRRRAVALLIAAAPLLYLQWQAPVRDVHEAAGNPAVSDAYFRPLLAYLDRQHGPPFRVEIPFTLFHWEAYRVAPRFPLARGWERQLDTKYNALFYDGRLSALSYKRWLRQLAVRFVAVPDAELDYSAVQEVALIDRGLPYLRLVARTHHWRIYAVTGATAIEQGAARVTELGPNSLELTATAAGTVLIRVRFSPYWAITRGAGCVGPDGSFTQLTLTHPGPVTLAIRFSLTRIRARSVRCS
jgi:hypothetical protein